MKKNLLIVLGALLSSACSINPPSVFICKELSLEKAYCINTIQDKEFFVDEVNKFNEKTWFEQRHLMLQLPVESWVEIKAYILKMCDKYKNCENVGNVLGKVDGIAN